MSGTANGGKKAAKANWANNPDHYKIIGAMGGKASGPDYQVGGKKASGFAAMTPEMRAAFGAKGGKLSRRSKTAIQPNAAML
jgi:general stress protein YciG